MRVLVIGAYGLVGSYVTARLMAAGHDVVGAGRKVTAAVRRFPQVRWVAIDLSTASAADYAAALRDVDAVVNCAGALQETSTDSLSGVHVEGLRRLASACETGAVRRFVHISAVGVERGTTEFDRTKVEGEAALRQSGLDWVILRPGLVLAPMAYGGSALLRGLAAFPLLIPAVHAGSFVQVVAAEDVAEAVVRALDPETPARFACDLVAPEAVPFGELLAALRRWLGLEAASVVALPAWTGRLTAMAADALGWLGWRSPLRSATLNQLAMGVVGDAGQAPARLGLAPRGLDDILARHPSGVQERWFARLYFLKPTILAVLALFWIVSGVVGLVRLGEAADVLAASGMDGETARTLAFGGACADILLGALVCVRRTAPVALAGMAALTAIYLVGASIVRPELWLDPMGPLVKAVPAAFLALAALAMMDER